MSISVRALPVLGIVTVLLPACSSDRGTHKPPTTRPDQTTRPAQTSAPSTVQPAALPIPRTVAALVPHLKDADVEVRRAAAFALGRLGEPESIWPLIRAGADDPDPNVRLAAAEAVTWLGTDPDSPICRNTRERLLTWKTDALFLREVEWSDLFLLVAHSGTTSWRVNWRTLMVAGADRSRKITAEWPALTVAEALCRLCAASGGEMCFFLLRTGPLYFTSAGDFCGLVRFSRRTRARQAALRQWGRGTEAGRRTHDALKANVRFSNFDEAKLADVIQYLRETTGVEFVVDWPALKETGVEKSTWIRNEYFPRGAMRLRPSLPPGEKGLWVLLAAAEGESNSPRHLDLVVDGSTVFLSTREGVERRMASRGRPVPKLVPTEDDEARQAIKRLAATRNGKAPPIRRDAEWALGILREHPRLRPIVDEALHDDALSSPDVKADD